LRGAGGSAAPLRALQKHSWTFSRLA